MNEAFKKPVEVLSVEDNIADAKMIAEMFKRSKVRANVNFVTDGSEALEYLHKKGKFAGAVLPSLILLDLNLPKMGGREVLEEVKKSPELRHIPVLIFTTSNSKKDIRQCYELQASCYFTKPDNLLRFNQTMKAIEDCWLTAAQLPLSDS